MKISVIIPTYKPRDYLWECLNSIKVQSLCSSDYEVIIVLNGCNEPYSSQIREYIDSQLPDHIVRLVQTDLSGVSNARNIALDLSRGEYITFIDDDDYVSPSYLEELLLKASTNTISLCYPIAFEDGVNRFYEYYVTKNYNLIIDKRRQHFINASSFFSGPVYKLIHRSIIGDVRFNEKFCNGEDSIFMFEISKNFRYVNLTSKAAIYYRRVRCNSATNSDAYKNKIFTNRLLMIIEYSKLYFKCPFKYNLLFYLTRIGAALKVIIKTSI